MRNIRFTFGLAFFILIVVFVLGQISTYNNLKKETENQVTHVNELFNAAAFSRVHEIELILDQIANSIRYDDSNTNLTRLDEILNEALATTHASIGYGFVSETGEFFATSADIDKQKLINLMNNDVTKESFMLTLKSDKMIIGRAYYFEAVKKWVIPLRKTVRQRSGKIIGVVTTGIDLDSISRITQSNPIKSSMRSMVINDSGLWRVYIDGPSRRNSDFYSKPASKELYDNAVFQLMSKYGVTVNTIKESERTYIYTSYAEIEDGISINAGFFRVFRG